MFGWTRDGLERDDWSPELHGGQSVDSGEGLAHACNP